jgi:intracellular sulfur oxidation DsrE/DsrF family protein
VTHSNDDAMRVVIHVDDPSPERQRLALGNARNLLDDVGEDAVAVEIVFNGPAISALSVGSEFSDELVSLQTRGVELLGCHNSMVAAGLLREDLLVGATVVPSGIAHLVRRQGDGWAYVRP